MCSDVICHGFFGGSVLTYTYINVCEGPLVGCVALDVCYVAGATAAYRPALCIAGPEMLWISMLTLLQSFFFDQFSGSRTSGFAETLSFLLDLSSFSPLSS